MNSNEIDINEWIVHHLLLGFQHIYIYDDFSNPIISNIINELPHNFKNCVTIYRLDSHYEIKKGAYSSEETKSLLYFDEDIYKKQKLNKQRYLMNYFLKTHKDVSKYCLFSDIDEFVYLRDDNNINDYLLKMDKYDIIYIPWVYYGTSFYAEKPKGLLIDNFRCHRAAYDCGKSIISMKNIDEILNIHTINQTIDSNKYFEYDKNSDLFSLPIHINHYITKSYKSVLKKKKEHCLGQTNDFYRSIEHILGLGLGDNLNKIKNDHIMEKYVKPVNAILNYELNEKHNDYETFDPNTIHLNGTKLDISFVKKNSNIELIETIINSNDVYYMKKAV